MMKLVTGLLLVLSLVTVGCSTSRPVLDVPKTVVPANKTLADVEQAIEISARSLGWKITDKKPGAMEAILDKRTHKATITITYDKSSYSIAYKDSVNLDYNPSKGTIHRNYNRWIKNLEKTIQSRI
jgi:hypothetical protein